MRWGPSPLDGVVRPGTFGRISAAEPPGYPTGQQGYPAGQQGYPASPQQWQSPQPFQPPQPFQAPPQRGNGLAVTAIVLSGLALLGVLGVAVFIGIGASMGPAWVLPGEVAVSGASVSGTDLEDALVELVEDDGGMVDGISCPESSRVGQGLVTVCHGSVDGWDWTGVVVFEDAEGAFIVNQL